MAAAFGRKGLAGVNPAQGNTPGQFEAPPRPIPIAERRTGIARPVEQAPRDPYAEQRAAVIAAFRAEAADASRADGSVQPRPAPQPQRQPAYHGDIPAAYTTPYQEIVKPRSMVAAYLFWFFLGGMSGHRFYLGRKESAFLQLGISALGWVVLLTSLHHPAGLILGLLLLLAHGFWLIGDAFLIPGIVRASRRPDFAASFH